MFDRRNTSRPASRAQCAAFGALLAPLALLTGVSVAEHPAEFTSGDEVHSYIQTYYRSPQPGRITAFIRSLGTVYPMTNPSANQAVAAFLSEVFRSNPKDVEAWRMSAGPANSRAAAVVSLATTLMNNRNGVLDVHEVSATTNDMYWGAFFASGNRQYVDKLIEELALYDTSRYPHKSTDAAFDSKADFDSFSAGATAAWSLSANLADSTVKQAVAEAAAQATGRAREVLHDVLTKSPAGIKADYRATINSRTVRNPSQPQQW